MKQAVYRAKRFYLVTGAAGAGKTTFLDFLELQLRGLKILRAEARMNDSGALQLQKGEREHQLYLPESFLTEADSERDQTILQELARAEEDMIFCELAAATDPLYWPHILARLTSRLGAVFPFAPVIHILDLPAWAENEALRAQTAAQIRHCHLLILNKSEGLQQSELLYWQNQLKQLNGRVMMLSGRQARIPLSFLNEKLLAYSWPLSEELE